MAMQVDIPGLQVFHPAVEHEALRRDVEQAILAAMQAAQARAGLVGVERGIEKGRGDAAGLQLVDLVLHQRDERRDDDGEAGPGEGGELEAERLAAAGRQQGEDIVAGERSLDDFALQRAKRQ